MHLHGTERTVTVDGVTFPKCNMSLFLFLLFSMFVQYSIYLFYFIFIFYSLFFSECFRVVHLGYIYCVDNDHRAGSLGDELMRDNQSINRWSHHIPSWHHGIQSRMIPSCTVLHSQVLFTMQGSGSNDHVKKHPIPDPELATRNKACLRSNRSAKIRLALSTRAVPSAISTDRTQSIFGLGGT